MKAIIEERGHSYFHQGKFLEIGKEIDLPFGEALSLSQKVKLFADFEAKPHNPELFKNEHKFALVGDGLDTMSGYGNCSTNLLKYSQQAGYKPSWVGKVDPRFAEPIALRDAEEGMAAVLHQQPKESWRKLPFEKKIAFTPFETTRIPQSWVSRINRSCVALIVPCEQNIVMMRNSGVTVPIYLAHWGVDTRKFYPLQRTEGRPFTFGQMGSLSIRKGTDLLVEAFREAFPRQTDVKLILKTSERQFNWGVKNDKRIQIDQGQTDHSEIINFYQNIDCFVFPTRGEGFGLPPLEAMATGVPAIVTGWSGPVDYMRPDVGWTLGYSLVPAAKGFQDLYQEDCGEWAEPDIDDLIDRMRYAYTNQAETKQKGARAAEYIQQEWTWEKKIPMFTSALEDILR